MIPQPERQPTRADRILRAAKVAGGVLLAVLGVVVLVRLVDYLGADLALGVLAFAGVAAAIGALGSADASSKQTIGGALVTIALLAFAAFALVAPAVLR